MLYMLFTCILWEMWVKT